MKFSHIEVSKKCLYALLLVVSACGTQQFEGPAGQPTRLYDAEHQQAFVEELAKRNIPFFEDEMGLIRFPLRHQAEVFGIEREIVNGGQLSSDALESMVVPTTAMLESYRGYFAEAGIPYSVGSNNGMTSIIWSQVYGSKVDQIRQQVMEDQLGR